MFPFLIIETREFITVLYNTVIPHCMFSQRACMNGWKNQPEGYFNDTFNIRLHCNNLHFTNSSTALKAGPGFGKPPEWL